MSQVKSSPESLTSKSESSLKSFIFCQVKSQVIKTATRVDSSPSHSDSSPHLCYLANCNLAILQQTYCTSCSVASVDLFVSSAESSHKHIYGCLLTSVPDLSFRLLGVFLYYGKNSSTVETFQKIGWIDNGSCFQLQPKMSLIIISHKHMA